MRGREVGNRESMSLCGDDAIVAPDKLAGAELPQRGGRDVLLQPVAHVTLENPAGERLKSLIPNSNLASRPRCSGGGEQRLMRMLSTGA